MASEHDDDGDFTKNARGIIAQHKLIIDGLKTKVRTMRDMVCAREMSDGSLSINYEAFVVKLGVAGWLELRAIGDAQFAVSGAAGEKPRVRMKANAAAAEA